MEKINTDYNDGIQKFRLYLFTRAGRTLLLKCHVFLACAAGVNGGGVGKA